MSGAVLRVGADVRAVQQHREEDGRGPGEARGHARRFSAGVRPWLRAVQHRAYAGGAGGGRRRARPAAGAAPLGPDPELGEGGEAWLQDDPRPGRDDPREALVPRARASTEAPVPDPGGRLVRMAAPRGPQAASQADALRAAR